MSFETSWDKVKGNDFHSHPKVLPGEMAEISIPLEKEKIPVLFLGAPGCGKTDGLRQATEAVARENHGIEEPLVDCLTDRPQRGQYGLLTLNASGREPEDMSLPTMASMQMDATEMYTRYESKVTTALPGADQSWYAGGMNADDLFVNVCAEELPKNVNLYKVWAQLFNERSLGTNYVVPPNVWFTATGNRPKDNAGAHDIFNDLIDRVCIVEVYNTGEAFLEYHGDEVHPLIRAVVKHLEEYFLFTQDKEPIGDSFCSPRTAWMVNRLLNNGLDLGSRLSWPIVKGIIGTRAATELFACYAAQEEIGDIDQLIDDPVLHKERIAALGANHTHNGRALLCSMTATLAKRVKKDPSQFGKLVQFYKHLNNQEQEVTFVQCALSVNKKGVTEHPAFGQHYVDNQDFYFGGTGR